VTVYYTDASVTLWHGDALTVLSSMPDCSVNCAVTSPPYFGLRDYGVDGQLGLEASPAEYVENLLAVFAQVRRVLADDGTFWLNLGDSYASGSGNKNASGATSLNGPSPTGGVWKPDTQPEYGVARKNLLGIPWRVAFALQDDGWILRNAIVWNKPNAMPESVTDRLSTRYEMVFMLTRSPRYWFDLDPIREQLIRPEALFEGQTFNNRDAGRRNTTPYGGKTAQVPGRWADGSGGNHQDSGPDGVGTNPLGRNPGDVWSIPTSPTPFAHFATFPVALASRCIQAGCKPGGTVLDPFSGSGTTGLAAARHGRRYVGVDLNAEYLDLSLRTRLTQPGLDFGEVS
jgi:DNA modification methylase